MPIPAAVYSSLWASYGPSQKIAAFNAAGTTVDELLGAGVPQSDIDWMLSNGYAPPEPARTIQQETIYRQPEPEPIYYEPEPIYTQPEPEPEPQPVYTPPSTPPAPVYNVFGLSWDSGSSLGTKQGYITTLLNQGITPDQIKAKIAEIDPGSATQENFDLLGIPKPPPAQPPAPPATTTTTTSPVETEAQIGTSPRTTLDQTPSNAAEDTAIRLIPGLGEGLFDSQGGRHTSTYVKTYKVVNGQLVEQPFTQADVNSNDFIFSIGSKTGGEDRQRVAQNYRLNNGQLVPVGEPQFYKGAQDIGFFEGFVRQALPLVASIVPGLNVAIGAALGATSTALAQALGNAVINASLSVAAGANPADALKNAALSLGVSQLVPNLTGNQFIDNALRSGATAALTGRDIGDAVANSLIATGAQAALSGASITGDRTIDSGLVSAATSAAQAAVTGADAGNSALMGFISGASAALDKPATPTIPATSTTIAGATGNDVVTGGATTGGLGSTVDVGMDTTPGATANDDVLGIVAQEQIADQAAAVNTALQSSTPISLAFFCTGSKLVPPPH